MPIPNAIAFVGDEISTGCPLIAIVPSSCRYNPYSYAANSPLSFSDPLGLKPLSDAELQAYTDAHTGWNRVGQWISDNKDYIAGAAMLIGGGILTACGVEPLGPMFIGAGVDAIIQRATTGHIWKIRINRR